MARSRLRNLATFEDRKKYDRLVPVVNHARDVRGDLLTAEHMDPTPFLGMTLATKPSAAQFAMQVSQVVRLVLAAVGVHRELSAVAVGQVVTVSGYPSAK